MATEATGLLLGGGAPTLTLESGALAALADNKVHFDVISTAGAGMLIGLLYAAPRGMSPRQALEQTKEMGVHDSIYDHFPVNFKVFHKPGSAAQAYRAGCTRCRGDARSGPDEPAVRRLDGPDVRDLVPVRLSGRALASATMPPGSTRSSTSTGSGPSPANST